MSAFVFRSVTMEGLMERLERAVTRLEKLSVAMQESSGVVNGGCINGVDEGRFPENGNPLRMLFD